MATLPFMVNPQAFALPFSSTSLPIGVIDLEAWAQQDQLILPPFPLVGIGNRMHPLASQLDVIIEAPATLEAVLESVRACPKAAAIAVQTLRLLEGVATEPALLIESIAYGLLQGGDEHAAWRARRRAEPKLAPGKVSVTRTDDEVEICLDREAAYNAIDQPMRDALRSAFELVSLDPEIVRVTLRGAQRVFSVGADLTEFGATRDPPRAHAIRMASLPAHAIARCTHKLDVHIHGACVGSALEMAAFARKITASPRAWFQLPELPMGLIPGAGGCVSVMQRIGRQRAALMILSGRRIGARTALAWGLIDQLVDD